MKNQIVKSVLERQSDDPKRALELINGKYYSSCSYRKGQLQKMNSEMDAKYNKVKKMVMDYEDKIKI